MSAAGAPAEGPGHGRAHSEVGGAPLSRLVLGSRRNTAAASSASQAAVAVERVQILALRLTGWLYEVAVCHLTSLSLIALDCQMSRGLWRPKRDAWVSKACDKEKELSNTNSTHNSQSRL